MGIASRNWPLDASTSEHGALYRGMEWLRIYPLVWFSVWGVVFGFRLSSALGFRPRIRKATFLLSGLAFVVIFSNIGQGIIPAFHLRGRLICGIFIWDRFSLYKKLSIVCHFRGYFNVRMSLRPWECDLRYVGVVVMMAAYPESDRASISYPFMRSVVLFLLLCLLYASRVFHVILNRYSRGGSAPSGGKI